MPAMKKRKKYSVNINCTEATRDAVRKLKDVCKRPHAVILEDAVRQHVQREYPHLAKEIGL